MCPFTAKSSSTAPTSSSEGEQDALGRDQLGGSEEPSGTEGRDQRAELQQPRALSRPGALHQWLDRNGVGVPQATRAIGKLHTSGETKLTENGTGSLPESPDLEDQGKIDICKRPAKCVETYDCPTNQEIPTGGKQDYDECGSRCAAKSPEPNMLEPINTMNANSEPRKSSSVPARRSVDERIAQSVSKTEPCPVTTCSVPPISRSTASFENSSQEGDTCQPSGPVRRKNTADSGVGMCNLPEDDVFMTGCEAGGARELRPGAKLKQHANRKVPCRGSRLAAGDTEGVSGATRRPRRPLRRSKHDRLGQQVRLIERI